MRWLRVFAGCCGVGCVGGGATAGVLMFRTRSAVRSLKSQLANEKAELQAERDAAQTAAVNNDVVQRSKLADLADRREIVASLWHDRLSRYDASNHLMGSYIDALPEAMLALDGASKHFLHMSHIAPPFVAFDHSASKLHELLMLISMARSNSKKFPLSEVQREIQFVCRSEPLVRVVTQNVRQNAQLRDRVKSGIPELCGTFKMVYGDLQHAYTQYIQKRAAAAAKRKGSTAGGGGGKPANLGFVVHGSKELLGQLYVSTSTTDGKDDPSSRMKEQQGANEFADSALELLRRKDVKSAVEYVGQLVRNPKLEVLKNDDKDVAAALLGMRTWCDAATGYLVDEQALDVLEAYGICLQDALSYVEPKQSSAAA